MDLPLARNILDAGVAARAFPAAVADVGRSDGRLWQHATGRLRYDADAPPCTPDTIFDLASLTKVLATTTLVMRQVAAGRLELDAPVGTWLPDWRDPRHAGISLRHLLEHSSGLPAHARLWEQMRGRAAYEAAIHAMPLERPPATEAVYSDLGFMLLGFILEDVGGASLDRQFDALPSMPGRQELAYRPDEALRDRIAPTEFDVWRNRMLVGDVHDENAAALDGVAGHAGLFGTAAAVGRVAQAILRLYASNDPLLRTFTARSAVPGSSRALGWDTMLPTSSCGTRLTAAAFGHTGFTGTSLWIDPGQDLYVVLLTNRVHPSRSNDAIRQIRARFHDAVVENLG